MNLCDLPSFFRAELLTGSSSRKKRLVLILSLFLFVALLFKSLTYLPESLLIGFNDFTGKTVVLLSGPLGIASHYNAGFLTVAGFKMRLILECTALDFVAILSCAILLYPGYSVIYKSAGILCGNFLIITLNALRLIILGIVGSRYLFLFDFGHDYLWRIVFVVTVFLIWVIWVEKGFIGKPMICFTIVCLISSAFFLFGVGMIHSYYMSSLAGLADKLLILMQKEWPLHNRIWLLDRTSDVFVGVSKGNIVFRSREGTFPLNFWQDIVSLPLFWGLMVATGIQFIKAINSAVITILKRLIFGTMIIFFMQLAIIVYVGKALSGGMDDNYIYNILCVTEGVSIITPVLLWFYFKNGNRVADSEGRPKGTELMSRREVP